MEIAEIVRLSSELLKLMSENGVKMNDWKYTKMYEEFKRMREHHIKYRAVITELALTHNLSRTNVERIIRRLRKIVK